MTSCLVSISTSLFISTNLGSLATPATTYVLIGLSVLMNAKELIHVIMAYKSGNSPSPPSPITQQKLSMTQTTFFLIGSACS